MKGFEVLKSEMAHHFPDIGKKQFGSFPTNRFESIIRRFNLEVKQPTPLCDLYSFCRGYYPDGILRDDTMYLFPPSWVFSTEYIENLLFAKNTHTYNETKMIPFMSFIGDGVLCVNLYELIELGYEAPIYLYDTQNYGFPDYCCIYDSIATFIKLVLECIKSKVYFYSREGVLDFDYRTWSRLNKELSIKSLYWVSLKYEPEIPNDIP